MNKLSTTIGSQIKKYRKLRKLTQYDMAQKLNTTVATISRYENGERKPSADMLIEICSILNISVSQIFDEELSNTKLTDTTRPIPLVKNIDHNKSITANENIIGHISFPIDLLPSDDCFFIKADDDSMAPIVNKDAYVLIHPQEKIENGEIGAILLEDSKDISLKRIRYIGDSLLLESINEKYEPLITKKNGRLQLIGEAVNVWNYL